MSPLATVLACVAGWLTVALVVALVVGRVIRRANASAFDRHVSQAMELANPPTGHVVLSVRASCGQILAAMSLLELEHQVLVHAHTCRGAR